LKLDERSDINLEELNLTKIYLPHKVILYLQEQEVSSSLLLRNTTKLFNYSIRSFQVLDINFLSLIFVQELIFLDFSF